MVAPTHIPLHPRLTAFDENQRSSNRKQIFNDPLSEPNEEEQEVDKIDDTKTMFRDLEKEEEQRARNSANNDNETEANIRDSVATIAKKRSVSSNNDVDPIQNIKPELNIDEDKEKLDSAKTVEPKAIETSQTPSPTSLTSEKRQSQPSPTSEKRQSLASPITELRPDPNVRAIEMLVEQNTKLHQDLEEAKRQIAQLQQTKIKYDYVVTKAYKKVKEIMAENQELRSELGKTQSDLLTLTTKLEAIQSVFGGTTLTSASSQILATDKRPPSAATQLRLKEKLNGSERSLHQPARD
eukprot:NODE_16_length_49026_cov_1.035992.p13 type:complete len:296 gc:universal NODE_16_length_49026_cov_1.035992:37164-36277(-)